MNSLAAPKISLEQLDAFCASLRLWLFEMAALVLAALDMKRPAARTLKLFIAAQIRAATVETRRTFMLLAVARLHALPRRRRSHRCARWAPMGFRHARRRPTWYRILTRELGRGGGSLTQRLARLRDLLARRDHWVARIIHRFCRGHGGLRLIAVAPPAFAMLRVADACAPTGADTS